MAAKVASVAGFAEHLGQNPRHAFETGRQAAPRDDGFAERERQENEPEHGRQVGEPSKAARYKHLDPLFDEVIDWQLIETHYPDMLRVAMSIKAGQVTASTILRRLGTSPWSYLARPGSLFRRDGCFPRLPSAVDPPW